MTSPTLFSSPQDAAARLDACDYLPSEALATITFLAGALGKPLLLEGPAGVGKTELAKAVSRATGRRLVRLQCYEGLDESRSLYEWDYGKQILSTYRRSGERQEDDEDLAAFFDERFLVRRPLLEAIASEQPVVLLIDEVDRGDPELEALLLEVLSDFTISVPEIGTFRATTVPFVVLTSNATREMTDALRRRCLHAYIDYPSADRERTILRRHVPSASDALSAQVVAIAQAARQLDLQKPPALTETIDWTRAIVLLGAEVLDRPVLEASLGALVKLRRDRERMLEAASDLIAAAKP